MIMAASLRHCERSEAIQKAKSEELDCFVATLLAMTAWMFLIRLDGSY